ncbi:hypothetical protein CLOM_g7024 [Closterium sp. NIES-68]|nr:hypothetical protein CLOM_g23304 [Closterium sp. NIES-68]GJP47846.1 hypothetical protein CLOM_g7024 [Closterium sp. NIES-68]GJP60980.1 hypothetical protein CLOP_g18191 [Closterium sp. NIES-67]GJP61637.1 hypothetical protein CLOP_g18778 [Closterium sp. NIES-67]GJP62358.1 hypothetical protein CLOP_g19433 [Closterium sp. NIES-67]
MQTSGSLYSVDWKQVIAERQETGGMEVVEEASTSSSKSSRFSKQSASRTVSKRSDEDPVHAVILVHGIVSTVRDWDYLRGELKKKLGRRFLIYASSSNEFLLTFQGVVTAGERLANEVRTLVKKNPSLQRITFVAHSLGGLFSRYAIALLHEPHNSEGVTVGDPDQRPGLIAGLEPVCFITLATPHLGAFGKGQLPFLLGVQFLEKLAPSVAPLVTGQTGSQLFLSDGSLSETKLPILVEMAADSKGKPFLSALKAFRLRLCYANAGYDRMVGWQTASIRRAAELPVLPKTSISPLYRHIVLVQNCLAAEGTDLPDPRSFTTNPSKDHELYQEYMIAGLQRVSWRKVDVNFEEAFWPFSAHNNILVKMEWLHFEGAGVVRHVSDTILEQHSDAFLSKL